MRVLNKPIRGLVSTFAVSCLALAACGSSSNSAATTTAPATTAAATDTTQPAATTSTVAAPTGDPIKIGVAAEETGASASAYKYAPGVAEAWAKWVNAAGGIQGRPVQIVAKDTSQDPAVAQGAGRSLVEDEKVIAMLVFGTAAEGALGQYLADQSVPVVGGTANNTKVNTALPNFFTMQTTNPANATSPIIASAAAGAKLAGAAVCAEVAVCAEADALYKKAADAAGVKYSGVVTVSASAPDYTAECLQFKNAGMDYVALALAASTALRLIEACQAQDFNPTWGAYGAGVVAAQYETHKDLVLAGGISAFPWWADSPRVQQYRDAMKQYAGSEDYRNPTATAAWAALELFRKTMSQSGADLTRAGVMAAYGKISNETLDGLLPAPLSFGAGKPASSVNCFWVYGMKDGKFTTLDGPGSSGNGQSGDLQTTCWPIA